MFSDFDRTAMQRALELAARGLTTTQPNPRVGCVIARKGRVLAGGWHEGAGDSHAEVAALPSAGGKAAGRAAKVARLVYAVADPTPQVSGRGAARLKDAGIAVEPGLLADQAAELNAGFM